MSILRWNAGLASGAAFRIYENPPSLSLLSDGEESLYSDPNQIRHSISAL